MCLYTNRTSGLNQLLDDSFLHCSVFRVRPRPAPRQSAYLYYLDFVLMSRTFLKKFSGEISMRAYYIMDSFKEVTRQLDKQLEAMKITYGENSYQYIKNEKEYDIFYSSKQSANHYSAFSISGVKQNSDSETLILAIGDRVKHRSFQEGVVTKMTPMGNDFLLEIDFSGIGNKKLMLRAASRYMEKI